MAPDDAALLEAIYPGLSGVYKDQQDPNPRLRAWLSGWEDGRVASRNRAMESVGAT
jgi:hypothetical protein